MYMYVCTYIKKYVFIIIYMYISVFRVCVPSVAHLKGQL